jgi:hypothetical protein
LYDGDHVQNMDDMAKVGHVRRKLTNNQARQVSESSESDAAMALRFGVSQRAIWNIRHGITYRHR